MERLICNDKGLLPMLNPWIKSLPIFPQIYEIPAHLYREHNEKQGRSLSNKAVYGSSVINSLSFLLDENRNDLYFCLAAHTLSRTITILPAMTRQWWQSDCPKSLCDTVQRFVELEASESLARREISNVQGAGGHGTFTMNGNIVSREISASYIKDECSLELIVRLPPAYPLRNVEVECRRRLGVSESRWRRWVLQIITLLSTQDGTVLEAILLWKHNVDKEFEGLEPCPICYSTVHPRNFSLPTLLCHTCNNKFHSECLYKWFNTSHKNKCPLCQQTINL